MGDVGSLALGGTLGTIAVVIKQEILLFFVGGIFVVEAMSVILQVGSFKLRGKRIFRMAPLHHHFELVRLERIEGDCAILDCGADFCAVCVDNVEVEVTVDEMELKSKRVLVVGLARTGVATALFCAARGAARDRDRIANRELQIGEGARKVARGGRNTRTWWTPRQDIRRSRI